MQSGAEAPSDPLATETHARVLDAGPSGAFALTENNLFLVRPRDATSGLGAGERFELGTAGMCRFADLSAPAKDALQSTMETIMRDLPEKYLAFYNRAGHLTLKKHAFTLLPGIGDAKALAMAELRGREGWEDFAALDEACGIDGVSQLAERLCQEVADRHMTPRLLDLLIRA